MNAPIMNTSKCKIVYVHGYYRYVNYKDGILTTGFKTKQKLKRYSNMILATNSALQICRDRYKIFYGKEGCQ